MLGKKERSKREESQKSNAREVENNKHIGAFLVKASGLQILEGPGTTDK